MSHLLFTLLPSDVELIHFCIAAAQINLPLLYAFPIYKRMAWKQWQPSSNKHTQCLYGGFNTSSNQRR